MSDPETNSNNKEEEPKKDIPKSKGVSNLDIEKLKALNVKFTKSLSFKIVLVGLIIFIVASSAYLAYLSFGQNSYSYDSLSDNKNKQMEVALLEAKKFADDSPIKAIKAIENYKTLAPLLENRKNYILTKLYQEIDEPALAFIRSYEIDKNYLSKYTSYERAKLAEKMGLEAVKLELIEWLTNLNDELTIEYLKVVKDSSDHDWWNDLTEEQKAAINRGLQDIDAGRVTPHNEVKAKYGL